MSSDFLTGLAGAIEDQFSLGENNNHSLDLAVDGTTQRYGKLGDFAKKFDQSQERRYLEEGYLRFDPYNVSVKQLEVLLQEPDITVLVKKRAFSTLSENYRLDHLDADEKLFYKATKILFQNKCQKISGLEKLSKIARVTTETGEIAKQLFPLILSLVDEVGNALNGQLTTSTEEDILNGTFTSGFGKLQSVVNQVRKVYNYTGNSAYTTWLQDTTNPFKTKLGQGTGVIEFTNITGLNTDCDLSTTSSSASITMVDPYNLMMITSTDIERALSDATNQVYSHKIFQFGQQSADDMAAALTKTLNDKRSRRGASRIEFVINSDTIFGKRVRAIIERSGLEINFTYNAAVGLGSLAGGGVNVSIESYKGGPDVGDEGLDPGGSGNSEINLFSRVVENIFNGLQLKQNSGSITSKKNAEITNYARRKLRTHYLGKLMIQSMDQVHIYISSKSRVDAKILGGLQNMFSGLGFLQNLNNTSANLKNQFESLFNPSNNANFQIEKSVIVGSDFPNWLWTILRSQFVNDTGGTHVYAGIVSEASGGFNNNGTHSVTATIDNNLKYLDFGKVNFKPSVDVYNGPFFDPLTPFKTTTDSVSGVFKKDTPILLDENKELLNYQVVKFKSGPHKGKTVTEDLLLNSNDKETEALGNTRNIYYCPDGFTYKWKEGIGTLVQLSESSGIINNNSTGNPALTKDPFAGQDVMNVISLAITGIPYNYNTFVKAARSINGYTRDIQSGADGAHSYYQSLLTDLSKNNTLWGNFIPFKNLVMDEASFEKVLTAQATIINFNDQISTKLEKVKDLSAKLQYVQGANKTNQNIGAIEQGIKNSLKQINIELSGLYNQVSNQLENSTNQSLSIIGNDVSYDFDEFINNDAKSKESLTNPNIRKEVRRKTNFLTRRLSWQVRANEDKNFLVVDDSYDKDYDLMAFEQELAGQMQAFNSEYSNVKDKVATASQLLDLEVYCDTQGHIRVRPPQYNKIPSSVFYRLFQLKEQTGIQIFPQFLEDLFINQVQGLVKNISIVEDQIRLDAAVLGKNTDIEVYELLRGSSSGAKFSDAIFNFVTDETGNGDLTDFKGIFDNKNPDELISKNSNSFIKALETQAGSKKAFNTVVRAKFLFDIAENPQKAIPSTVTNSSRVNDLVIRLKTKTGQQVSLDNFLTKSFDGVVVSSANSQKNQVDVFKVANDIADKVSERQKLIKLAANALKNAKEYLSLDNDKSTTNKLLFSSASSNSNIPEVFASMIEDESYDDYGPGSGSRYIIKDYQISDLKIREVPPDITYVEVKGAFNTFAPGSGVPDSLTTTGGGNALISASAIDYDMWKMYGMRNTKPFSAPFLTKPETQCAPYAAMILSRMRKNILQAYVTIAGNEFMQPGDVVYIESRDLLFYVQKVSHIFNYGSNFKTNLTLNYGHPAGDYIPTTLDLIGKLIYNNRDSTYFVNYRQDSSSNEQHLGTFIIDSRSSNDLENDSILGGNFGSQNISVINNIKNTCKEALSVNRDPNSTMKATVELRVFYNSTSSQEDQTSVNSKLSESADVIFDLLTNFNFPSDKNPLVNIDSKLEFDDVDIYEVNINGNNEIRSPSQKAIDMVRNLQLLTGSKSFTNTLYSYIIDCWITFEEK